LSSRAFHFEIYFRAFFCQIVAMSGITFMVDERGQKTAAVIDLRKHEQLWEDFHDALLAKSRAREPRESLESVRQRLKSRRNG
jgi:hypothetical protein